MRPLLARVAAMCAGRSSCIMWDMPGVSSASGTLHRLGREAPGRRDARDDVPHRRESARVHQRGRTEGGGPGAENESWKAGELTGSARPRPAPWLKPSATANSCEGEGGSLEIFLPWILFVPCHKSATRSTRSTRRQLLFSGRDNGMDLAAARIETIHAALFPPGDARRCSETSASAIYSSSGDLLAEAVPSECGPLGKRGREDRRGGEAHADCQRGRENSRCHWCLHVKG
jgi:hypothetical protein